MDFTRLLFFDGAMGTLLQQRGLQPGELPERWNLAHPADILAIHKSYLSAGADIITTNTFGANSLKFSDAAALVKAAVALARRAVEESGRGYVALDMGPTGKLLEPFGTLSFEDAVSLYAEQVLAGKDGADCILIETMSDLREMRAAVLAAKENAALPVFATLAFGEDGRLLTGADVATCAAVLEGLGVDAIGFNCGVGPAQLRSLVPQLLACTSLPVIINPNAGLPIVEDGKTVYKMSPAVFAEEMLALMQPGVGFAGGCCGTTPAYIAALKEKCAAVPFTKPVRKNTTIVASASRAISLGAQPLVIGERINPTGKPKLKEALRNGDFAYVVNEAIAQEQNGADILDVNAGVPGIDEVAVLTTCVQEVAAAVSLPLQLDTANPAAMEKALRTYCGKALINSVNGKQSAMDAVFPLAKKYGGVVVCLTLDENGIPETAEGRLAIAERIIAEAAKYGIEKKNLLIDTLTMSVSTRADNAAITLDALEAVKARLGVGTVLGVSNISFGLPERSAVNAAFLTLAMQKGLTAAIINPGSRPEMSAVRAFNTLNGYDENCAAYIAFASGSEAEKKTEKTVTTLADSIRRGLPAEAARLTKEALLRAEPLAIINTQIIPALEFVGEEFEKKTLFLPQLLSAAKAAEHAFAVLQQVGQEDNACKGTVILATVKGDIHDIGKNIVAMLLGNYGFHVVDLGKDVPPDAILQAVRDRNARLLGLSALMTTTVPAMHDTICLVREAEPGCKVMVGGAVLSEGYAAEIGADYYGKDAMAAVRYAMRVFADA